MSKLRNQALERAHKSEAALQIVGPLVCYVVVLAVVLYAMGVYDLF